MSITDWINQIKKAVYGEEVREAIANSLETMNNDLINKADKAGAENVANKVIAKSPKGGYLYGTPTDPYVGLNYLSEYYYDADEIAALITDMSETGGHITVEGRDGKSAFQIAIENGYTGTESEWLESLKGVKGDTGAKGDKGDKGDTGIKGEDGAKGDKGDKGDSYILTSTDKQEIASIATADTLQQTPLFANSVDECTDTSKVYVLPDGYIYAYMSSSRLERLNKFDVKNAALNKRLGSGGAISGGQNGAVVFEVSDVSFANLTEYIVKVEGKTLVLDGNKVYGRVALLNSSGAVVGVKYLTDNGGTTSIALHNYENGRYLNLFDITNDTSVTKCVIQLNLGASTAAISESDCEGLFVDFVPMDRLVTNQEWVSTGYAFVPADYEDRIAAVESKSEQNALSVDMLKSKVESITLSGNVGNTPPDYWLTAINNLGEKLIPLQDNAGAKAFQFIWMSDIHGAKNYTSSNNAGTSRKVDIGKIAQYTAEKYNIPFVAVSGDIISQTSHELVADTYKEFEQMRDIFAPIDRSKLLLVRGNHDGTWGVNSDGAVYRKNIGTKKLFNQLYRGQAEQTNRVFGGDGTYFYVDSPQKVRFIMLNSQTDGDSSEKANGEAVYNSFIDSVYGTVQLKWLTDVALDMPEGFSAVVMAHNKLHREEGTEETYGNMYGSLDGSLVAGIIDAYNKRTAYNGSVKLPSDYWWGNYATNPEFKTSSANADFTNAKGEVVAFFHGHIHKDTVDTESYSFPCISITTAGADVRDENPVKREPNTATETAMDIVTIDMEHRKIYTTRLGAGSDRELSY